MSRTVIVTGGASGIGLEMCRAFAALGDDVHLCDVHEPNEALDGVTPHVLDVRDENRVGALFDGVVAGSGRLDVVCNNAGIGSTTSVLDCTVEEWDAVMAVNARGVFLGTKHALRHMLPRKDGVIINTASAAALVGVTDRASYSASKGAVIAFSRQVASQYAGTGVRCNWLNPGTVDSPWVGRLLDGHPDPEELRSQLVARQPMGRLGEPAEIAAAAVYLASDAARFITGTDIVLDGGLTAR
ncbi:short-chain dehydrogenase/reductase SDR [Beutenbergia cavernae DSM 12333]|uniref:Short-chain dehydrogenase/reductase SDR n=1 Tax=Beutenbergia cavernae (strain ATCC BAA-8 / DSM 12333 / CCUG 43141 / JCM 11478 / NBRC 16432 / NCIMB 13614 / HKI 0122) TaxID=471853 RepID=C5C2Q6_BEUC1|nr:SDR family oxidoreductase [Beutenbergia cavernae]ACQ79742.1 short-chain dehydrogenase/reductase SDR [Beutenbergia cavernae DSM 12333]